MTTQTIKAAIRDLQQGKLLILTDHPERENEGDLIIAAQSITTEIMNFIIRNTSGIVCVSLAELVKFQLFNGSCMRKHSLLVHLPYHCCPTRCHHGVSAADRVTTMHFIKRTGECS